MSCGPSIHGAITSRENKRPLRRRWRRCSRRSDVSVAQPTADKSRRRRRLFLGRPAQGFRL